MALTASQRAELAHRLIASLDDDMVAEDSAAATASTEALRRLGEIERGEVQPISQAELFDRVRRRLDP